MNTDRYTSGRPLLKALGILNVYQLNLYQTLIFMFKLKHKMIPEVFQSQFSVINHRYPTRYSSNSFKIQKRPYKKLISQSPAGDIVSGIIYSTKM